MTHGRHKYILLRIWLTYKIFIDNLLQMIKSWSCEIITFPYNYHTLQLHLFDNYDR